MNQLQLSIIGSYSFDQSQTIYFNTYFFYTKLLTRFRLNFSHLNEHRFLHNFQDCLNPLCSCSLDTEDISHYLLHCQPSSKQHNDLKNSVNTVFENFNSLSDNSRRDKLLCCDQRLDEQTSKFILEDTLNYIRNTERFSRFLFI